MRLCELAQTKAGYQLTKYYQREMLIDPAADEAEKMNLRVETLRALLKEAKIRARKTVYAVPGQSVFIRPRTLPPVPEYKVTQIVRYEVQQQIPFSLDHIALDYQVLQRTEAGGYDVMIAAIKVDVVERQLEILRQVRRRIHTVDVAPLAAYNWLKHTGEFGEEGECVALVDLGAATTDIVIERENQFRMNRSLNIGGNDITQAIAKTFGMSFEEAEKAKRERGFAPTGDPQRDGKGGEVIGQMLSRLVSEITRSFAFFRSQPGGSAVSRVIVTGGGACLRNIVPYLQRQLGVPVRIAQPLAGLAIGPAAQEVSEHPEQACVALGLALRCSERVPIAINLVPPRVVELGRRKQQALYWALSLVVLALVFACLIPRNQQKQRQLQKKIEILENGIRSYRATGLRESDLERRLERAKNLVLAAKEQVDELNAAHAGRNFWLDYFQAINDARPPGNRVWLTSIETTELGGPGRDSVGSTDSMMSMFGLDIMAGSSDAKRPKASAAAPGGAAPRQNSGFPGLGARGTRGAGAAGSLLAGGDAGEAGGALGGMYGFYGGTGLGGAGAKGGGSRERQSVAPARPNGMNITGLARDVETIRLFKEQLEKSGVFAEGGVYFDESTMDECDVATLYSAPKLRPPSASEGRGAGPGRRAGAGTGTGGPTSTLGMGMGMGMGSLGMMGGPNTAPGSRAPSSGGGRRPGPGEEAVYTFAMVVEFAQEQDEAAETEETESGASTGSLGL